MFPFRCSIFLPPTIGKTYCDDQLWLPSFLEWRAYRRLVHHISQSDRSDSSVLRLGNLLKLNGHFPMLLALWTHLTAIAVRIVVFFSGFLLKCQILSPNQLVLYIRIGHDPTHPKERSPCSQLESWAKSLVRSRGRQQTSGLNVRSASRRLIVPRFETSLTLIYAELRQTMKPRIVVTLDNNPSRRIADPQVEDFPSHD